MTPPADRRLYVPQAQDWLVRVKPGFEREYCHAKTPGEDHYHLLMGGEVIVENGEQRYCLNCAARLGLVTADRLYWQKGRGETIARDEPPIPDSPPHWTFVTTRELL